MSHTATPASVIFDANYLLGALKASNPELPDEILHAILRSMIAQGQVEVAQLSTDEHPLKSRIRLPVTGQPKARDLPPETLSDQSLRLSDGQIGHTTKTFEMLGPKAAAAAIGISRSTLDNWRRAGRIIALPKGRSGHVIPLVQFVHSCPVQGLDAVLAACSGDAVRAWKALATPSSESESCAIDAAASGDETAIPALLKHLT